MSSDPLHLLTEPATRMLADDIGQIGDDTLILQVLQSCVMSCFGGGV